MQLMDYAAQFLGVPASDLFGRVQFCQNADGTFSISRWDPTLGTQPTSAQIATALTAPEPQSVLQTALTTAILAASDAVTAQILPTTTQLAALVNAAIVVAGNGGAAPLTGTFAANFAALSSSYGAANITAFATFIDVGINESLALGAAERTALASIPSQTTGAELATILATFETALSAVLTAVNAVFPVPIVAPAAISIVGINA